jgi:splicing factor 1
MGGQNGDAYGYAAQITPGGASAKRDRDDNAYAIPSVTAEVTDPNAPRKRRSRWGEEKSTLGVATALGANVSQSELERYAVNVRLEEIARKIQSGDVVPPERERSPSPAPTYDAQGRRTNTREVRYRKKLEDERVRLIDKQLKLDPNFKPPMEYAVAKRNMKPSEKIFLPVREFPEINFFGLIVGPRGNSLKKMERESGAKISIRGKGSVKEGKGKMADDNEEEMHCVVTADDEASVRKCIRLINLVIETAASTPEAQNDHKRNQLRELASLNGTLRDDENQVCQNCGQKGHRKYECPEQRNWTANIICHRCGQQGHLARDCTQGRMAPGAGAPFGGAGNLQGGGPPSGPRPGDPFNSEYENLMAELGQGGAQSSAGASHAPAGAPGAMAGGAMERPIGPDGKKIPPWRDPNVWNTPFMGGGPPRGPRHGGGGYEQSYGQAQQQQWGGGQDGYGQQQAYGVQAGAEWQQQQPPQGSAAVQQGGGDYREAWAEYYRQQGLDPAAQQQPGATDVQQGQQDYSKEWAEWVFLSVLIMTAFLISLLSSLFPTDTIVNKLLLLLLTRHRSDPVLAHSNL